MNIRIHFNSLRNPMNRILALLTAVVLLGHTSMAHAQSESAASAVPVVVILATDYPAFTLEGAPSGAVQLRAIVMFRHPGDGGVPTVLLNPEHATAHTLYEALSIAHRRTDAPRDDRSYAVVGMRPGVREPNGPTAAELRALIARLRAPDAPRSQIRHVEGSTLTIPNARVFFNP